MSWEVDYPTVVKLLLASFLGGMIGLEREMHGRPAGFRTHLLVSLGACLFVTASVRFYALYAITNGLSPTGVDPGRVAAQVVAGIGFLGAGAIMREKASVRGLTTAACLWVAAAIGLSCGIGMFGPAVIVTFLSLLCLLLLKKVEKLLDRDEYVHLKVWGVEMDGQKQKIEKLISDCQLDVMKVMMEKNVEKGEIYLEFELRSRTRQMADNLVEVIAASSGISRVRLE